ncbi:MAG: TerB family tellurite resistance protein [Magnetospirillum sp. WYHS-4]
MSIWGKVIGGVAGFAMGGPLGALAGAVAGHAFFDKRREEEAPPALGYDAERQLAFTMAVIVLAAKMAKADGVVSRDEIAAFRGLFHIPPDEIGNVGRLFDEARADAAGFEPYAAQIASLFAGQPAVLVELLDGLFAIAKADGAIHEAELDFLRRVAAIFGFGPQAFERIRQAHMPPQEADPYEILGVERGAADAAIKAAWRKLSRENHPDRLVAQGLPPEFAEQANRRMAAINAAYDRIAKERGMK